MAVPPAGGTQLGEGTRGGAQPRLAARDDGVDRLPRRRRRRPAGMGGLPRRRPRAPRPGGCRLAGHGSACRCPRTVGPRTGNAAPRGSRAARWATADMAYRRGRSSPWAVRRAVPPGVPRGRGPRPAGRPGGLDPRGRHAGRSSTPCGPRDRPRVVRSQRGNADDALMRRLHGAHWRALAATGRGLLPAAPGGDGGRRPRRGGRATSEWLRHGEGRHGRGRCGYLAHTGDLLRRRVTPGPRDPGEVAHHGVDQRRHPGRGDVAPGSRVVAAPLRAALAARRLVRCSSTGTARSSTTCPTTATLRRSTPWPAPRRRSTGCVAPASDSAS